ncbi:hypothetical protein BB560_002945 [Smittium megazygosporum]|uniref:Uncharacterized protein n=1 Tax=Smittium megazygosporum TaxID=133381 RepID=A0A2T9ZDC0_9FUNG|nr:hypothetical protein BB560_002945 [Smittium megazygosporum]
MSEDIQEIKSQISEVTSLLARLLQEKEKNIIQDPYITSKIQVQELGAYPRLLEAIHTIGEDHPAPIFDTTPPFEEIKFGTLLFADIDSNKIIFANNFRILLLEADTMLTQAQMETIHNILKFPVKGIRLNPSDSSPLFGKEAECGENNSVEEAAHTQEEAMLIPKQAIAEVSKNLRGSSGMGDNTGSRTTSDYSKIRDDNLFKRNFTISSCKQNKEISVVNLKDNIGSVRIGKLGVVEEPSEDMEWPRIPTGDVRAGNIY